MCVGYIALVGTGDINFCHIVDKDVCLTLKTFQITYHIEVGSWEVMCLFALDNIICDELILSAIPILNYLLMTETLIKSI